MPTSGDVTRLEPVLELDRDQSTRLIDLIKALDSIPVDGEGTVYVDDQVLRDFSRTQGRWAAHIHRIQSDFVHSFRATRMPVTSSRCSTDARS